MKIINDLFLSIKKYGYTNWRDYTMTDMEWNIQDRLDKDLLDKDLLDKDLLDSKED